MTAPVIPWEGPDGERKVVHRQRKRAPDLPADTCPDPGAISATPPELAPPAPDPAVNTPPDPQPFVYSDEEMAALPEDNNLFESVPPVLPAPVGPMPEHDGEDQEIVTVPVPVPLMTPRQQREVHAARMKEIDDDFRSWLVAAGFGTTEHYTIINRTWPEHDSQGRQMDGRIGKFTDAQDGDLIGLVQAVAGGGKYKAILYGPKPPAGIVGIKGTRTFKINGPPRWPNDADTTADREQEKSKEESVAIVERTLAAQEKQMDRMAEENREMRQAVAAAVSAPRGSAVGGLGELLPLLQAYMLQAKEERERREQQRREEKEERERKEAQERTRLEKLAKDEKEERERKEAQERTRLEKLAKDEKEERERRDKMDREEREARQRAEDKRLELMAAIQREAATARESNHQFLITQMQEQNKQAMVQLQQASQLKTDAVTDMIKNRKSPFAELLEAKQTLDLLTGNVPAAGKTPAEKLGEIVGDAGPKLISAVGDVLTRMRGPPKPAGPPPVLPESVAIAPLPSRPRRVALPPAEVPAAAPSPPLPEVPMPPKPPNDLKEYAFPGEDADLEEVLQALVKDLDLALQRDLSPTQAYHDVVAKFPTAVRFLLKSVSAKQCVATVEREAPPDWVIASPRGMDFMAQLHAMLKHPPKEGT